MAVAVQMPTFGLTEGEATLVRWLKSPGDLVQADEPLFEAENEKASLEVPAPGNGVLLAVLAPEGATVALQSVVAWIGAAGEALPGGAQPGDGETEQAPAAAPLDGETGDLSGQAEGWVRASPLARRLAREHGIEVASVVGSGPHGRVVVRDIEAALEQAKTPAQPTVSIAEGIPLTEVRRATVQRLAASASATIPVPLFVDVDMRAARKLRKRTHDRYVEATGAACSYNALILRACSVALREHPALNGQWDEDGVRLSPNVNIALAVQVEAGLLAPVVAEVERKSLFEIHCELIRLVEAARARRLAPEQLGGGTFTVSNLGSAGVRAFVPVINPPQVAILGVGEIAKRAVVVKGKPKARWMATLCLVFDHRAVDGLPAAQFLRRIKELLENPYLLI